MLQQVKTKLEKRSLLQSETRAIFTMQIYAEELGINKKTINQTEELYLGLKIKHGEKISNNIILAAVCLIKMVKSNNLTIGSKAIINKYRQKGHRISQKVMNRIILDCGLKLATVKPESFVKHHLNALAISDDVTERIELRGLDTKTYWELLEKTSLSYLSFLDMSYRGGSPPSILSAYAIFLADTVLNEYYPSIGRGSILNKRIVSYWTGKKIFRCSSQLIAKMNKCLKDNLSRIIADVGDNLNLLNTKN